MEYTYGIRCCKYYEHFKTGGTIIAMLKSKREAEEWIKKYGLPDMHYYIDPIRRNK